MDLGFNVLFLYYNILVPKIKMGRTKMILISICIEKVIAENKNSYIIIYIYIYIYMFQKYLHTKSIQ